MKMIVFADLHTDCTDKIKSIDFSSYNADVCFTLGDINREHLRCIKDCVSVPVYGVLGNHDECGMLESCGIEELSDNPLEGLGIIGDNDRGKEYTAAGLSGSAKYKDSDYCMLTQQESLNICKNLIHANILISHDCAYGLYGDRSDLAHCGLKGISRYIRKHKPILCIHGHHHENTVKIYRKTIDICVFGCSVIGVGNGCLSEVIRVFKGENY